MNKEEASDFRKYLHKVRKIFNIISNDCNQYVDEFDTINYSLNKMENILNRVTSIHDSPSSKTKLPSHKRSRIEQRDDSSTSSQEEAKVKAIIESCRVTTDTLSKKIKVLFSLPNKNQTVEYKQKQFLKHSESSNPRGMNQKKNPQSHRHRSRETEEDIQHRRVIKKLDMDILKLTKELEVETKSNDG